jgi:SulP family sulfate permease
LGEAIAADTRTVVLDMHRLISMDTSGLEALEQLHRDLSRQGRKLVLASVNEQPLSLLRRSGFALQLREEGIADSMAQALAGAASPWPRRDAPRVP